MLYLLERATYEQVQQAQSMSCTDWGHYHRDYCNELIRLMEVTKRCPEVQVCVQAASRGLYWWFWGLVGCQADPLTVQAGLDVLHDRPTSAGEAQLPASTHAGTCRTPGPPTAGNQLLMSCTSGACTLQGLMLRGVAAPRQALESMPTAAAVYVGSSSSAGTAANGSSDAAGQQGSRPALNQIVHMLKTTGTLTFLALLHGMPAIFDAAHKNVLTGGWCCEHTSSQHGMPCLPSL